MSSIKLKHSGGNSVSLNPPTSAPTSSDVAFKLPNADGSNGQFMKTDGSGNLTFATLSVPSLKVLQVKFQQEGVTTHSNSGSWTNSVETGHNLDITPISSTSSFLVHISTSGGNTNDGRSYFLRLRRKINNANDTNVGSLQIGDGNNGGMQSISLSALDTAPSGGWNTSDTINYRTTFGQDGSGTARYDYSSTSLLTVWEIAA